MVSELSVYCGRGGDGGQSTSVVIGSTAGTRTCLQYPTSSSQATSLLLQLLSNAIILWTHQRINCSLCQKTHNLIFSGNLRTVPCQSPRWFLNQSIDKINHFREFHLCLEHACVRPLAAQHQGLSTKSTVRSWHLYGLSNGRTGQTESSLPHIRSLRAKSTGVPEMSLVKFKASLIDICWDSPGTWPRFLLSSLGSGYIRGLGVKYSTSLSSLWLRQRSVTFGYYFYQTPNLNRYVIFRSLELLWVLWTLFNYLSGDMRDGCLVLRWHSQTQKTRIEKSSNLCLSQNARAQGDRKLEFRHQWVFCGKQFRRHWRENSEQTGILLPSIDTHRDATHCISSHSHFYNPSFQKVKKWFLMPILKIQTHTTWSAHHLLGCVGEAQAASECVCDHHTQPCKCTATTVPHRETRTFVASSADVVTRLTLVWLHRHPLLISEVLVTWPCFYPSQVPPFFFASSASHFCRRLVPLQYGFKSQWPWLSLCITGASLSTLSDCHQESIKHEAHTFVPDKWWHTAGTQQSHFRLVLITATRSNSGLTGSEWNVPGLVQGAPFCLQVMMKHFIFPEGTLLSLRICRYPHISHSAANNSISFKFCLEN